MQGFGGFSGFIAAAFVAYLTSQNHLNASMTCYQVFRKTLVELGMDVFKNIYSHLFSLSHHRYYNFAKFQFQFDTLYLSLS